MIIRTYEELITLPTFEERYRYLKLNGQVGEETFGFDRYLNQTFYTSDEWRKVRRDIIVRDLGCDLGMPDRDGSDPSSLVNLSTLSAAGNNTYLPPFSLTWNSFHHLPPPKQSIQSAQVGQPIQPIQPQSQSNLSQSQNATS